MKSADFPEISSSMLNCFPALICDVFFANVVLVQKRAAARVKNPKKTMPRGVIFMNDRREGRKKQ